jgi:hypothetical protein
MFAWLKPIAGLMLALMLATPSLAQSASVPDENILARLVWTTMVTLDAANRTDNYTVLHALGSENFRKANSPESLRSTFKTLRDQRVDIGRAVLVSPTYYIPPGFTSEGYLRLRGGFEFRPNAVRFDLLFIATGGAWQLDAISVAEMDAQSPR